MDNTNEEEVDELLLKEGISRKLAENIKLGDIVPINGNRLLKVFYNLI